MHLNHSYYSLPNFVDISSDLSLVKKTNDVYKTYFPNGVYKECLGNSFDREHNSYAYGLYVGLGSTPVHGGALAVKRDVFSKVKWKDVHELELSSNFRMEDYEFNMDVVFNFQKSMIIDLPLYGYRC